MRGMKMTMIVDIDNRTDFELPITEDKVNGVIERCLLIERNSVDYEVSISFVEPEEIEYLNQTYRNIQDVTDVLSFPMDDDLSIVDRPILGDIVINVERAKEQSLEYGHSFEREIIYLLVHSMFHLLGYDHMTTSEKKAMREKEKLALGQLGVYKYEEQSEGQ